MVVSRAANSRCWFSLWLSFPRFRGFLFAVFGVATFVCYSSARQILWFDRAIDAAFKSFGVSVSLVSTSHDFFESRRVDLDCFWTFFYDVCNMQTVMPNNSPEPPPMDAMSPPSRLTDWAARLSFCR
jgi:hypothetical protein